MLAFLEAIVLGIAEGITEWLPISSTGHMLLLYRLYGINPSDDFWSMFLVMIQLGAIAAVIVLYYRRLWPFHRKHDKMHGIYQYVSRKKLIVWLKILLSCVPAAVIGLPLDDWLDAHLHNAVTVALMLILYGVLFLVVENRRRGVRPTVRRISEISWRDALLIGLFQVLALIPGTSRSGVTILGALVLGLSRRTAAEYSFFLAIPVMVGAGIAKLTKFGAFSGAEAGCLIVGMAVAFVVSMLTISFFMNYIRTHNFKAFGWYRIVLGAAVLVLIAVGIL